MTRILRKIFVKRFVVSTSRAMEIFLYQVKLGFGIIRLTSSLYFMPDITEVMTSFGEKMSEEEAEVSLNQS